MTTRQSTRAVRGEPGALEGARRVRRAAARKQRPQDRNGASPPTQLAGVSTRRFERTREPVGEDVFATERSASKSAASRAFIGRTGEHLQALMARSLQDIRLAALMLDGIDLKGRCCVVALGVSTDGVKVPLGLWDGSTENKTITVALLADLVDQGLDIDQGVLVVLDGGKALRAAVNKVFGPVPVQRCVRHKERNVLDHLPERDRPKVKHQLRATWAKDDHRHALDGLRRLAGELEHHRPGAASSLREGLEEIVTLMRLEITGNLRTTLQSTNAIESMISILRRTSRNVKRWQSGDMCLRWTAAGMLEAEQQFRKTIGFSELARLAVAVEHDLADNRLNTDAPAGRYARHRLTINSKPSPRNSTAGGASPTQERACPPGHR
jgi:putative transposase